MIGYGSRSISLSESFVDDGSSASDEDAVGLLWRPGEVILGLYEVLSVIETGGMGVMYRVRHRGWEMDLAVKVPRPALVASTAQQRNFERKPPPLSMRPSVALSADRQAAVAGDPHSSNLRVWQHSSERCVQAIYARAPEINPDEYLNTDVHRPRRPPPPLHAERADRAHDLISANPHRFDRR